MELRMHASISVAVGLTVALAAVAGADRPPDHDTLAYRLARALDAVWRKNDDTGKWELAGGDGDRGGARCTELIAELDAGRAPGSTPVELRTDTPELVAGTYTLDDVRSICKFTDRYVRVARWERWGKMAVTEAAKIGGKEYYDTAIFARCGEAYDALIKAGVAPTTPVLEDRVGVNDVKWAGTVEELRKKWCDAGLKTVRAEVDARLAPYRKLLKADKLALVVLGEASEPRGYIVPGVGMTADPKRLAAATVWYAQSQGVNSNRASCNGGQEVLTVTRYQFNAAHKRIKTTSATYCGSVPASAYK